MDALESQIPYYLTQTQKEGLIRALKDFNVNPHDYYINKHMGEMLQGDGWSGFDVFNFNSGKRDSIKGIILSNSCDISSSNKRDIPSKAVFAPIVKLSNYAQLLNRSGLAKEQVDSKLQAIREQKITTLFYLPPYGDSDEEYITMLDDLRSVPVNQLEKSTNSSKMFTLSMYGFYLFVFKISIHFCRFHEEVAR